MNTNVVICCHVDSAEKTTFSEAFLFYTEQSSDSAILQSKKLTDNIFTVTVTKQKSKISYI